MQPHDGHDDFHFNAESVPDDSELFETFGERSYDPIDGEAIAWWLPHQQRRDQKVGRTLKKSEPKKPSKKTPQAKSKKKKHQPTPIWVKKTAPEPPPHYATEL